MKYLTNIENCTYYKLINRTASFSPIPHQYTRATLNDRVFSHYNYAN